MGAVEEQILERQNKKTMLSDQLIHGEIRDQNILSELTENPLMFFCISANAGTGKTLLTYDIANELMSTNKNILLIHCGILNRGHIKLIYRYKWNIVSIKDISNNKENINLDNIDFIFVDE